MESKRVVEMILLRYGHFRCNTGIVLEESLAPRQHSSHACQQQSSCVHVLRMHASKDAYVAGRDGIALNGL
eukprot:3885890-Amphidinium_carterae.1